MISIIKRQLHKLDNILDDLQYIKCALGRLEYKVSDKTQLTEYKVFSQWGEDGLIQWLINNIAIPRKVFIEFGVQNYTESNTRFLLMNNNWAGLIIDGDSDNINYVKHDDIYWRYNLKAVASFITAENINDIFRDNGIEGEIGLLSVDIDGVDYWVWKAIDSVNPAIVVCEYNHRFGAKRAVTVPYKPDFVRGNAHYSGIYYGASIQAFAHLAARKGYSPVAGNMNGNNVFFVRNDLLNDVVKAVPVEKCWRQGQFREGRKEDGSLAFYTNEEEQKLLAELELVDVSDD